MYCRVVTALNWCRAGRRQCATHRARVHLETCCLGRINEVCALLPGAVAAIDDSAAAQLQGASSQAHALGPGWPARQVW